VTRRLIVNADDFGLTPGVNRAIVACHVGGVVTSTSLMVDRAAAGEAAELSREHPGLSVGLHWDPAGRGDPVDMEDLEEVGRELFRQLERFEALTGAAPTHLDSHWHVHREPPAAETFRTVAGRLGMPLRAEGPVAFVGGFYAQWEWKVTQLEYVSVDFLCRLLHEEVAGEWTELGCHPGYVEPDLDSVYLHEREEEVRTLTDPRVRETIEELGIRLASYGDLPTSPDAPR
jgi:chitin disaccharide deacetylase